jgi:hypothetical protein
MLIVNSRRREISRGPRSQSLIPEADARRNGRSRRKPAHDSTRYSWLWPPSTSYSIDIVKAAEVTRPMRLELLEWAEECGSSAALHWPGLNRGRLFAAGFGTMSQNESLARLGG